MRQFIEIAHLSHGDYLSVAKKQETVEHVENLRRRLVNRKYHSLVFLSSVVFQRRHQTVSCRRIQTRSRFLELFSRRKDDLVLW